MITVAEIISDTNIGGGGRYLLNYLACYDKSRFRVFVILPRGSALTPRVAELGVPFEEIDAMADKSMDRKAIGILAKILKREKPDLVHTHGSLSGRIAARMAGCRVVFTRHCAFPPGKLVSSFPGRTANRLLNTALADGVIAVGEAAKQTLVDSGIPAGQIHVMLNGVAPLPVPDGERRREYRRRYGFSDDDFVVGILARIEDYKGHADLLEAVEKLLAQGRRVKLLVAGEGGFEPELRRRAAALPAGSVVFAGFVSEVEGALGAMDVQVNASYASETSSLSLLEGMSMGLPAVVTDCGGNPLLITHAENGLVVPMRDTGAMAGAIARLMDDRVLREGMHRRAVEIFEEKFTGQAFARNLEAIYCDVLKGERE